jgi:uncharacterized protein (DUF1330 family)
MAARYGTARRSPPSSASGAYLTRTGERETIEGEWRPKHIVLV